MLKIKELKIYLGKIHFILKTGMPLENFKKRKKFENSILQEKKFAKKGGIQGQNYGNRNIQWILRKNSIIQKSK